MITLNTDQEIAATKIIDFIEGNTKLPYFTLTGGPGTGKTAMLREALSRTHKFTFERSAAAIAHAAKNVIYDAFDGSIPCYTVAQWLGMKMSYADNGEVIFKRDKKITPLLKNFRVGIFDEVSMANDSLYYDIMKIVEDYKIKLIVVGDLHQLPPVGQDHDSKFFDRIDSELTIPMRFLGPISNVATIYKDAIDDINLGYSGNSFVLNDKTNRIDNYDDTVKSGYFFKNNIYQLVEQVSHSIKSNPDNINHSRVLAYKNATIELLNKNIRKYIYGQYLDQFESGEIVISRGGFSVGNSPVIHNGKILKVEKIMDIIGPYEIPCLSLQFKDFFTTANIVVVKDNDEAMSRYNSIKNELLENAKRESSQWVHYYTFVDSFAYFDYAYSVNVYKA